MQLARNTRPKKSPSGHHRTTLEGFATEARIDNRKKNLLSSDISSHALQYRELRSTSVWDRFVSLGAPQLISTGFASWQRYCITLQYWVSAKLCGVEQRARPIFGRAAITMGIGPYSSSFLILDFKLRRRSQSRWWLSVSNISRRRYYVNYFFAV